MLLVDAVGLVTFAYIGAFKAADAGLGVFPIIFFAALTAAGGGIMRDVLVRELPTVLYTDFYTTPAALLGAIYALSPLAYRHHPVFVYGLLGFIFILRVYAIWRPMQMWKPGEWAVRMQMLHRHLSDLWPFSWLGKLLNSASLPTQTEEPLAPSGE